ncbi:ABC transporter permease [Streptomyces mutabilis]|uniref:ABC transporter permease n=1 Tax=Streptomyces mutabilis TaxID=67332 RepID=UPI00368BDAD5
MSTDVVNTAVLRTEIRLFGREPGGVFWILLFPTLLLVILGSVPSFRESDPNLGGLRPVDAYVPVAVLLGLIVGGLQGMPPTITGYRENGILRRMSTTPVRPSALLTAQMLVFGGAALLSALVTLTVGRLAFDVTLPEQPFGYLLALLLALGASLALGALLSALSRTTKIATAIGSTALFPAMFCAGVWLPVEAMPDLLADIVGWTPFGAAAQALNDSATGAWPGWTHLGVLAAWTVLLTAAASRWFRWE